MTQLYAGTFCGEFGWELFVWQGYLRKLSKKYDETFVACRRGNEVLYQDFATKVIPQDVECEECDMWDCEGYEPKTFVQTFDQLPKPTDMFLPSKKPTLRYDHTHNLDHKPLFAKFYEQEFVKFGSKSEPKYDLIIHARAKKNKVNAGMNSQYRNWSIPQWEQLLQELDMKIAWVGTKKGAHCVENTGDDLRGISLEELTNVLANSKLIVGPSSGPIHLAALCGCPQITWWGDPYGANNRCRFEKDWNPFDTPVIAIHQSDWNPSVHTIAEKIKHLIS